MTDSMKSPFLPLNLASGLELHSIFTFGRRGAVLPYEVVPNCTKLPVPAWVVVVAIF